MNKWFVAVAVLLAVLLVVGCARAPPVKAPSTEAQVSSFEKDIAEVDALNKELDTSEIDSLDQDLQAVQ